MVAELEEARREFTAALDSLSEEDWHRPSANRAWTNGQLLFHILLGFALILPLWRIMQFFGRLPPSFSRIFAAALDLSTPVFNRVNALGPRVGARLFGGEGLRRKYEQVHAQILRRLSSLDDGELRRAMHAPTRWDPSFSEVMTIEDLPHWAASHLRHHRAQLRLSRPP